MTALHFVVNEEYVPGSSPWKNLTGKMELIVKFGCFPGLDFLRNTVDMIESSCWQKCFELRQRFIDSLHLSTDSGTKCEAPLSTMELASLSDDSAIPPSKKRKLNKTPSHTNVTFRVSCKCTSKVKRHASVKVGTSSHFTGILRSSVPCSSAWCWWHFNFSGHGSDYRRDAI